MKKLWKKSIALMMVFALCLPLSAQAVTTNQMKNLLEEYYLREIPEEVLSAETVEAMLEALNDPYTLYMNEEEYNEFCATMSDSSVVGIGISALEVENGLAVLTVYDNSPAKKVGVSAGDVIICVDGKNAAGEDAETVSGWLKGEEGTSVTFSVLHTDGTQEEYTVQRAHVDIPGTMTELLSDGTTGYITCRTFGEETPGHFTDGILAYDDADLWIVDLRDNGGGDVYAVTQVLGSFLGEEVMFYMRDKEDDLYGNAAEQGPDTAAPVMVLVSDQTASSAEIFSMVIKKERGGIIIGSRTFGKGIAQIVLDYKSDPKIFDEKDAARITAYQFYNTGGTSTHRIGVVPDLLVATEDADNIASLFYSKKPEDTAGWLQLILGGQNWFVNMKEAVSEENRPYFKELLEALPPEADCFSGTSNGWQSVPVSHIASITGIKDYTPRKFSDLEGERCQHAADTLLTYGFLAGYPDGTFRSASSLTRAELCSLLVQVMQLKTPQKPAVFTDVKAGSWQEPVVQAVCAAGYMKGIGEGKFDPNGTVTEEQMLTVLGRLAADLNLFFDEASQNVPAETGVPETFHAWAVPWVWLLAESQENAYGQTLSMLADPVEEISPRAPAARGECAEVLYNILHAVSILPY